MVTWFAQLVLDAHVSMRAASRVLGLISEQFGLDEGVPHWTTGRLWLQRLGHAQLTTPLPQSRDWAWLIDHSVQIGQEKCLVIVGIQLANLPEAGQSLRHTDMSLVALLPRKSWTQPDVDAALEEAVSRTGVPRVIVHDHGADIEGGVRLFRQRHPRTASIYDIKHKSACLLKRRLEKNPRWQQFQREVGATRCAIQQTELAFLVPPTPKLKSRFMNLEDQLTWAGHVLDILRNPTPAALQKASPEVLRKKLGWLEGFREEVGEWAEWQQVVNTAVIFVNRHGLYSGAVRDVKLNLPAPDHHTSSRELAGELVAFIKSEASKARRKERLPGSTEILESCFGKFKVLEREQSKGGFTSLLMAFGAMLMTLTPQNIMAALQHSKTKFVKNWKDDNLGSTLPAQRKIAFAASATETG